MILNMIAHIMRSKNAEKNQEEALAAETGSQQIRDLAYKKWEASGCPVGRDDEFWISAESELFGEYALKSSRN
jgi:hypothetical protein